MIRGELKTDPDRKSRKKIDAYKSLDPMELIQVWKGILYEDNIRRAMAGLDVNERPMPPTMRERGIGGQWRTITKNGRKIRILVEVDPNPPAGPPLLPWGKSSRLITLAETRHEIRKVGTLVEYAAQLGWPDFTAEGGDWVLGFHTNPGPEAPYPRRDMTSRVSDKAVALAQEALDDWLQEARRV